MSIIGKSYSFIVKKNVFPCCFYLLFSGIFPVFAYADNHYKDTMTQIESCDIHIQQYLQDQLLDSRLTISLDNMGITDDCASSLINYLYELDRPFSSFSIRNNFLGKKSLAAMRSFVDKHKASLRRLDLSYNHFTGTSMGILAAIIHKKAGHFDTIRHLIFSGNRLGDLSDRQLNNLVKNASGLYELNVSDNHLSGNQMRIFSAMIASNKHLTHFDISNNPIDNAGLIDLGQGIKLNNSLIYLNLSSTKIGNDGGDWLLEWLAESHHAIEVNVHNNYFSDQVYKRLLDLSFSGNGRNLLI
jgi:Ran GTPase-activating protein (RanGAP) involved in mRNA processing and transport